MTILPRQDDRLSAARVGAVGSRRRRRDVVSGVLKSKIVDMQNRNQDGLRPKRGRSLIQDVRFNATLCVARSFIPVATKP